MTRIGIVVPLVAGCLAAGVLSASVLADSPPPGTTTTTSPGVTVPLGVTLGGVAIGGLASDAAVAAVQLAFDAPVQLQWGATRITVTPDLLGLGVPADTAVAKALTVAPDTSLGLRATFDRPAVTAFVATLSARFDRAPISSRLLLRNSKPLVTPATPGTKIDQGAAVQAVSDELVHGTRTPIQLQATFTQPATTPQTIGPVIVILRDANRLTLYNGMKVVRRFVVATGQTVYPTPLGNFRIVVKWKNPWWYPPASPWAAGEKPIPPGPANPLGTRWMGLSAPGVGIHGTPEASSIGYSLSHGCIRMLIPQAQWLFDHVNVGTPVFIVSA